MTDPVQLNAPVQFNTVETDADIAKAARKRALELLRQLALEMEELHRHDMQLVFAVSQPDLMGNCVVNVCQVMKKLG